MDLVVLADPVDREVPAAVTVADPEVAVAADLVVVGPAAADLEAAPVVAAASAVQVADVADLAVVDPVVAVADLPVARAKVDAAALPVAHRGLEIAADAANRASGERHRSQCATRLWTRNPTLLAGPTSPRPIIRSCVTISAAAVL